MVSRTDRVTLLDTYQYNDSVIDNAFVREPYCVKFQHTGLLTYYYTVLSLLYVSSALLNDLNNIISLIVIMVTRLATARAKDQNIFISLGNKVSPRIMIEYGAVLLSVCLNVFDGNIRSFSCLLF